MPEASVTSAIATVPVTTGSANDSHSPSGAGGGIVGAGAVVAEPEAVVAVTSIVDVIGKEDSAVGG
jgi:hypothetical protein